MSAINGIIPLTLVAAFCSSCALERKLEGVVLEADLSSDNSVENAATIDARKPLAFCYVSVNDTRAVKLRIDPGPIAMTVRCGSDLRSSVLFSQDFEFVAAAGHKYKIEYEFYRCMRLIDETLQAAVSERCR